MASQSPIRPENARPAFLAKVIFGAATGTLIEWYDFFIFGSLTSVLAIKFYPPGNDTFALIAYLATIAVGFLVRPFGALFFGSIGDLFGRRIAFIITLSVMGSSTAAIGLLPTFKTAGWFSPVVLILIRVLQGLAIGGEYGGAAVYVAEHTPDTRRGFYTSIIQTTASLGFCLSLLTILTTQIGMSPAAFEQWGWRLPFLLSLVLVSVSLYIRIRMKESPIFSHIKSAGLRSTNPIVEAFASWSNLRQVLISLFGATAGQGVVWYTSTFYALFYLQTILKLDMRTADTVMAAALIAGMPFYIVFGHLSDRIGRKRIMLAAFLLGAITFFPIYKGMRIAAGNSVAAVSSVRDKVTGDIKLTALTRDPATGDLVPAAGATHPNKPLLAFLIWIQFMYACMAYGPIAAYLVEAFPAKVRYTSISLPYHIGNGVFGGLLPLIGLSLCASTHNIYAGLCYPVVVAALSFVFGAVALRETHGTLIWNEVAQSPPRLSLSESEAAP